MMSPRIMRYSIWLMLLLSFLIHYLHRIHDLALQVGRPSIYWDHQLLVNVALWVPVLICVWWEIMFQRKRFAHMLPFIHSLALSFIALSIMLGGDGIVEYHFIFMVVIGMTLYHNNDFLPILASMIFGVYHIGIYFIAPELCLTIFPKSLWYPILIVIIQSVFGSALYVLTKYSKRIGQASVR